MSKWLQCRLRSPQSTPPARNVFIVLSYGSVHSAPQKKRTHQGTSCELWAVSVTTPIHSLTRCLHAHRARQDAIGPRSDCSSWSRPGRRNCHCHSHCRPSSSLPVRRCAYCRSVALRLRTSRKSRQQIKAKFRVPPSALPELSSPQLGHKWKATF